MKTPLVGLPDLRIVLAFGAMALGAIGFGYLLGNLLPALIAAPLSATMVFVWSTYPNQDGDNLSWRNITGFNLWDSSPTLYYTPDSGALFAPIVISLGIFALLWSGQTRRYRLISIAIGLGAISLSVIAANLLVEGTRPYPYTQRSPSHLTCETDVVQICLWPEQEAASGKETRRILKSAVESAQSKGYYPPLKISAVAPEFRSALSADSTPFFSMDTTGSTDQILRAYIEGVVARDLCPTFEATEEREWALWGARAGLATLVGLAPEKTLPFGPGVDQDSALATINIADDVAAKDALEDWRAIVDEECSK